MSDVFASALKKEFDNDTVLTENGAVMYKTSGKKLVDINFAVSSLRQKSDGEVIKMFSEAYYENKEYAVRWLFMLRDVRGGLGERKSFRTCFKWLAGVDADAVKKLVPVVAEYGRFDDLYVLFGTQAEDVVFDYIDSQLSSDYEMKRAGKPVSLLAKWLPSCNASSPATKALAKKIYRRLDLSERQYRKTLSELRAYIDVTEVKASANKWSEIDYEKVPSMANLRYKKAFLKNDRERREEYIKKLSSGEAKINAATCFPSDIAYGYLKNSDGWHTSFSEDAVLEGMWKALPQISGEKNIITVVDTSSSMSWDKCDPKSGIRPLDVAFALGVYCSEHLTGPFKDKCITFNNNPSYIDFSGQTRLFEKLNTLSRSDIGGSTNIEAVMDLLLTTAVDNNVKQEDIPEIVILSDMEFNRGCRSTCGYDGDKTALFNEIADKYKAAGYKLPKIFYWNLNSRSNGIPIQTNELGVGLVSGYSQNTVKMLLSGRLDPWEILKEQLDTERYAKVTEILK